MASIETWYGLFIAVCILTGIVPILRFYALRNTRRTAYLLAGDFFYFVTTVASLYNMGFFITDVKKEIRLRSIRPPLTYNEIIFHLYDERFGKVCSYLLQSASNMCMDGEPNLTV